MAAVPRVLVLGVALAALAGSGAGCGAGGGRPATGPTAAGTVNRAGTVRGPEAAQATAQTEFGLLAGGDYAGAWDLWTADAQRAVGRADFVALGATCPRGVPATATVRRLVDDDTVALDWRRGDRTGTATVVYTGGSWRYQPDRSTLDGYRQGRC
jgi:hypothetical protein